MTATDEYAVPRTRRRLESKDVAWVFAMVLQVGALVWGAATLNASVGQLAGVVVELRASVRDLGQRMGDLDGRLRVLEDRVPRR